MSIKKCLSLNPLVMTQKILSLVMILLFSSASSFGQNALTIAIGKNDPANIAVKFNNGIPIANEGKLDPGSPTWTIKVNYGGNKNYSIVLKNNQGNDETLSIKDFAKTYTVENNIVKGETFTIPASFDIILMENDTEEKVKHTISYSNSKTNAAETPPVEKGQYALGSAIYDANYLKKESDDKIKLAILAHYADCAANSTAIIEAYKGNTFISEADIRLFLNIPGAQSKVGNLIKSAATSIGGLDVTNLADGLAKFLVNRTKQELNIAFFEDFRNFLQKEEFKDLRTVFPETYKTFTIIGDEIYNFDRYLQTLRESFKSDLANLTTNLATIVDNHPLFFEKYPELRGTLHSGLYIAESIRDEIHPGEILASYSSGCDLCLEDLSKGKGGISITASIQILRLFSESLRNPSGLESEYWASGTYLKQTLKDPDITRYYFGLTRQLGLTRYAKIPLGGDTTLVGLLDKVGAETLGAYQNYILKFIQKTDKLSKMLKAYSKPASDSLALEQYYNYFKSSLDLLEYATEAGTLPKLPARFSKLKLRSKDYFDIANTTSDLVLAINRKNYASAVRNAVHIYEVVKVRDSKDYQKTLETEMPAKSKEIATLNTDINSIKSDGTKKELVEKKEAQLLTANNTLVQMKAEQGMENVSLSTRDKLFKYGTFMATIVTAESSDDVEEAIEAFALPAGSARIKRETKWNVALNGYLGGYVGWEKIRGLETDKKGTYGLTAPIGVSISRGNHLLFLIPAKGWSTSLFLSAIDLGAIASFRFSSETVKSDTSSTTVYEIPDIQFEDIFSPGAFLSFGIPRSPLSINMGAQVGPNLRKVSVSSVDNTVVNDYADRMYWRFSLSLVVDIPIVNFYTKSKD